jgi:hypothetical protein
MDHVIPIPDGALLIVAPVVAHTYTENRDKDRIAEFFRIRGSGEVVPLEIRPFTGVVP